jgi:uncharacterized protein (TIGR03437 family)
MTHTAGFRHEEAIDAAVRVFRDLATQSEGTLAVEHTEDLSAITAGRLREFDAVFFFTSGELALSAGQKADLLDFIRQGKGFGGAHSATDTLYTWPEYGDMIGAYFDDHPWAQDAAVDVEDPENPIVGHLAPGFRFVEEYYQFRAFSRDVVRVLLTLDTRTVDLTHPNVRRTDGDFALAWMRPYGRGRVFYTAFGHFAESWTDPKMREMLRNALRWLVGYTDLDATPRSGPSAAAPAVAAIDGPLAPGGIVKLRGERLTSGSSLGAASKPLPVKLAGTRVEIDGQTAPLFAVSPGEVTVQVPFSVTPGNSTVTVYSVNRGGRTDARVEPAAPQLVAYQRAGSVLVLYATGLGTVDPAFTAGVETPPAPLMLTNLAVSARVGTQTVETAFAGLAPLLVGVYQVNVALPAGTALPVEVSLDVAGRVSNTLRVAE